MADNTIKIAQNVPGAYYVDQTCSVCRTCLNEAPSLLQLTDDESAVFFARQPVGPEEEAAAQSAMEVCPTTSIGNDG